MTLSHQVLTVLGVPSLTLAATVIAQGDVSMITTIPWLQLGIGGGLAILQGWMLWRLVFDVQPKSEARWQAVVAGLETKIANLSSGQDGSIDKLFERIERMEEQRRAEQREIAAAHRQEMADKRHEFLNALAGQQKQWLEVWKDIREHQKQWLEVWKEMRDATVGRKSGNT